MVDEPNVSGVGGAEFIFHWCRATAQQVAICASKIRFNVGYGADAAAEAIAAAESIQLACWAPNCDAAKIHCILFAQPRHRLLLPGEREPAFTRSHLNESCEISHGSSESKNHPPSSSSERAGAQAWGTSLHGNLLCLIREEDTPLLIFRDHGEDFMLIRE